jgi:hypothetical protein
VKSISMAKFTNEEIEFLRMHGNDECKNFLTKQMNDS